MNKFSKIITLLILAVIAGCSKVTTDPGPAFGEVKKNIAQRNGQLIQWRNNTNEDTAVRAKIEKMLQSKLSVDQVIQIALLNNPRLQGIYEQLGIAQANLVQAGLLKNPVFDVSLKFVEGPDDDYILEMGAAKDFLEILLVDLRKDMAKANLEMVKSQVTSEVMNHAAQTQIAFYDYQAALQSHNLNKKINHASKTAYEAAKRLHDAGNITELELATQRSLFEQTKLTVAVSMNRKLQARENLNKLMGLWGNDVAWKIKSRLAKIPNQKIDLNDIESKAIRNSLDLIIAKQKIISAAAKMGIDTAEIVFPEMSLGAEAEREGDGTWSVGPAIGIGVPIFDFGQARTAAGQAQLRKLWNFYTALAIDIRAQARKAKYSLINARKQAEYYKSVIVPLSEEITLETQLNYNAMQLGVFHLLQAKQMEYQFKRNYITALNNYWRAYTELQLLRQGHLLKGSQMDISDGSINMSSGGH